MKSVSIVWVRSFIFTGQRVNLSAIQLTVSLIPATKNHLLRRE